MKELYEWARFMNPSVRRFYLPIARCFMWEARIGNHHGVGETLEDAYIELRRHLKRRLEQEDERV